MDTKRLLIISSQSPARTILAELLNSRGWSCIFAGALEEATRVPDLSEFPVLLVSNEIYVSESWLQFTDAVRCDPQLIVFGESELIQEKKDSSDSKLFAFLNPKQTSARQIELSVQKAIELARYTKTSRSNLSEVYRHLLESSPALYSASTLSELLELTCKEIAQGAGFRRAILVLGDEKFRIQTVKAYFADENDQADLSDAIGQPLVPLIAKYNLARLGRGFAWQATTEPTVGNSQHLILPLEKSDGSVFGYLTMDEPVSLDPDLSTVSQPIALLLNLTSAFIETQSLRSELKAKRVIGEASHVDRTSELRHAKERFSRLVNLTDDIVYLTDADGRVVYLNEAFGDRLGYIRENYIGQNIETVLSDLATESEASAAAIAILQNHSQDRLHSEIDLFTKSGYRKTFVLSHHWVRQGEATVAGQGLLRDVTEQRELQSRLARSERLGLVGKLASGVAHEINNPLQAISSHLAGITERVGKDSIALESLGIVSDSVERIRLLMRSMMDLQRSEASVKSMESINGIVERSIALMAPQLRSAGIEVLRDLDAAVPECRVNAGEIEQVLINLILNSIDAMPQGGVLTFKSELAERRIVLKITDTGRGIPQHVMGRLFQAFSSYRERGGGLGMGLYMSSGIIQQHGGELRAESPPGQGATLIVSLPIDN